ncbi:MAG: hypothetical protein ACRBBV_09305 [Paracoccaceae bacterium]
MPQLAIPALAGAGGGGAAAGGTVLGGLTAAEVLTAGAAATALVATGVATIAVIDDYLDSPATQSEAETIAAQAGDASKAERRALEDCANCVWCQINIQAQGNYLPLRNRSDAQGIGPYLRRRTVFAREGLIVLGLTHEFARGLASRRNFREIESWGILTKTAAFISSRPPAGLPNGEHRAGGLARYANSVRYDIMVMGTINAFMA